eukprot:scaffold239603_cov30-Tisochrysis_lutea.AAC.1
MPAPSAAPRTGEEDQHTSVWRWSMSRSPHRACRAAAAQPAMTHFALPQSCHRLGHRRHRQPSRRLPLPQWPWSRN